MEGADADAAAAANLVAAGAGGGWPLAEEASPVAAGCEGGEADAAGGAKRGRKPRSAALANLCQVPNCATPDLEGLKRFMRRYRICEACMKAQELLVEGEPQRFCQQCGRFHRLAEFSGTTRSCKRQLELHNARRRKAAKAAQVEQAGSASSVGAAQPEADAAADVAATLAQVS